MPILKEGDGPKQGHELIQDNLILEAFDYAKRKRRKYRRR